MRKIAATAVLVLTYTLVAQDQSSRKAAAVQAPSKEQPAPTSSAEPSKIALAREADIRKLLELTRVAALMVQGMNGAEKSMRPLLERSFQPGEYRDPSSTSSLQNSTPRSIRRHLSTSLYLSMTST